MSDESLAMDTPKRSRSDSISFRDRADSARRLFEFL